MPPFSKKPTTVLDLEGALAVERAFSENEAEVAVDKIATAQRVIEAQSQTYIDEEAKAVAIAEAQIILSEAGVF